MALPVGFQAWEARGALQARPAGGWELQPVEVGALEGGDGAPRGPGDGHRGGQACLARCGGGRQLHARQQPARRAHEPGFEEFLREEDWSAPRVFRDIDKLVFPPSTDTAAVKAIWKTIGSWHGSHQRSADVSELPVSFTEQHMDGKQLGASQLTWHAMWATLLQFSPRPPTSGSLPPGVAAAATSRAAAAAATAAATAAAAAVIVPRASAVNVVNHTGYTVRDAAVCRLRDLGDMWVQQHVDAASKALFWIELKDPEGELRVGLGFISSPPAGEEPASTGERWIKWFERKGKKHAWASGAVAFKWCLRLEGRRKVPYLLIEKVAHFLPVAVELCQACSEDSPKVTKLCRDALFLFVSAAQQDLIADLEASSSEDDDEESSGESGEEGDAVGGGGGGGGGWGGGGDADSSD